MIGLPDSKRQELLQAFRRHQERLGSGPESLVLLESLADRDGRLILIPFRIHPFGATLSAVVSAMLSKALARRLPGKPGVPAVQIFCPLAGRSEAAAPATVLKLDFPAEAGPDSAEVILARLLGPLGVLLAPPEVAGEAGIDGRTGIAAYLRVFRKVFQVAGVLIPRPIIRNNRRAAVSRSYSAHRRSIQPRPAILLRPRVFILEPKIQRYLQQEGLPLDEPARPPRDRSSPAGLPAFDVLDSVFDRLGETVGASFRRAGTALGRLDPAASALAGEAREESIRQVEFLRRRALAGWTERDQASRRRRRKITRSLYPGGRPQEEVLPAAAALEIYGPGILAKLEGLAQDLGRGRGYGHRLRTVTIIPGR
ncbi:MAG: bacillithiol biosynthesis BshC [Firmicutes bacterium]|nr:bacillithiol biosynthesis BshC [Bacillota bacterium]